MNRVIYAIVIFLCLSASGSAANDPNGNELSEGIALDSGEEFPASLHYEINIAYNEGRMSLNDIRIDNNPPGESFLEEEYTECDELATDKIISKYSEYTDVTLCKLENDRYRESLKGYGDCANSLSSTRDTEYYLEAQDASGEFLLSCSFTFTIEKLCFDCVSGGSGKSSSCVSDDRFDFFLSVPYHKNAQIIKIFEVSENKKRKTVLSIGVSEFKDAPNQFVESG
jgi:hypothetical protein